MTEGAGSVDLAWLLVYARDRLEEADAQLQVLDPSGPQPPPSPEPTDTPEAPEGRLWLPALWNGDRE